MELYLIRHGQSANNVSMIDDESNRVADPPLTELGHQQALVVAHYLKDGFSAGAVSSSLTDAETRGGFGITKLYCSPMLRALQTCQPISRALDLKPEVWIEIHEHGGIYLDYRDERGIVGFGGITRADLLQQFADYTPPDDLTEAGWWNPALGAEDITGAQSRAIKVAAALLMQADSSERIALVTHGTFIDCLIKALLNQLPDNRHYHMHNNTGITRVDFLDGDRLLVRYINRVDHLKPELIS